MKQRLRHQMLFRILTLIVCLYAMNFQIQSEAFVSEALGPLSLYQEVSSVNIDKVKFDLKKYKLEKLDIHHPTWHWQWD